MKELIVRAISGALYVAIILFAMYASREWFVGLFLILGGLTTFEFLKLIRSKGWILYAILPALLYFISYDPITPWIAYSYLALVLLINILLMNDLFVLGTTPIFERRKFLAVLLYLFGGFVFITLIPMRDGVFEPKIVVGVFILIWANDSFAYLIGKNFGKRKLMPQISPKKTIEGFIGGMLGAILAAAIIFKFMEVYSLLIWSIMAILITCVGTTGDLIQSKFKRKAGVKDSGGLMPGHGGIYDRLDSIIYSSPIIFVFLEIIDYVS